MAMISAWADGSRAAIGWLNPAPRTRSSCTTTAPTGTSPAAAARLASARAASMYLGSRAAMPEVPRRHQHYQNHEQPRTAQGERVVYADRGTQQSHAQAAESSHAARRHGEYAEHAAPDFAGRVDLHQGLGHGVEG